LARGTAAIYIAETRIPLEVIVYAFRRGRSPEDILRDFPSIRSLAKLYGAITFVLEHPQEIDAYLAYTDEVFERFKAEHPLPPEMLERFKATAKDELLKAK
jgi:uncharacterized protein (DUF433 family)